MVVVRAIVNQEKLLSSGLLLETQEFSSRSQMAAFFFTEGAELWNKNDPKQEDEDK